MSVKRAPNLLLVEDDHDTAELVCETLADHFGVNRTLHVDRISKALELDPFEFDLVLSDINLPDGTGIELLNELLRRRTDLPVVMVTSESVLETAMQAIRSGAYDYIVKTGDYLFTIPLIVEKNLAVWQTKRDNHLLQTQLKQTLEELRVKNQQLQDVVGKLESLASTDPLTGLANRRCIQESLERSFAEASRYKTDLACVMIDLDGFKKLNDMLGHQMGDRLLEATGRVLEANCRRSDVAGRYGGDEFVVLLPHTDPQLATSVAKRIQSQFISTAASMLPSQMSCNMSIGIACMSMSHPASADQLVALADAALYRAKQAGKARIFVHQAGSEFALAGEPSAATAAPVKV